MLKENLFASIDKEPDFAPSETGNSRTEKWDGDSHVILEVGSVGVLQRFKVISHLGDNFSVEHESGGNRYDIKRSHLARE
jgi:hypothetical protein